MLLSVFLSMVNNHSPTADFLHEFKQLVLIIYKSHGAAIF